MDGQTGSETKRGIHVATLAVMKEVGVIGKTRENPNQKYKFRGIDDVVERVGPLMAKHGIVCAPRVLEYKSAFVTSSNGKPMAHVHAVVEHRYSAADGSFELVTTIGEAMDTGDKASPKAMSIALKYSHTEFFQIATFESDRDTEEHSPELAPRTQSGKPPTTAPATRSPGTPRPAPKPSTGGATFPGYGSMSGKPLSEGTDKDLAWYAGNCRKSIADPAKAKWIDKERATLAAIEAEQARRGGS